MMSLRMVWAKGVLTTAIAFCSAAAAALSGAKPDWTGVQWAIACFGVLGATFMAARNFIDRSVTKIEHDPNEQPPAGG